MKIQLFSSALLVTTSAAFAPTGWLQRRSSPPASPVLLQMSTTPDYNRVHVAKTGGRGANTASQQALQQELSLGAPPARPKGGHFMTKGGIQVTSNVEPVFFSRLAASGSAAAIEELVDKLDKQRGVLLASSYEYPGRYARWSLGFVDPPLEVSGKGNKCTIRALNMRGKILLPAIQSAMEQLKVDGVLHKIDVRFDAQEGTGADIDRMASQIDVVVVPPSAVGTFSEEERSRQPSLFSVVRSIIEMFSYKGGDGQLGLYGAFGYDLTFQFEPIQESQKRDPDQRDIVLYLPDEILVVDQDKRDAWKVKYEFCVGQKSTQGINRNGLVNPFQAYSPDQPFEARDTPKNEFANSVERAKREFAVGNLFEAVLSQTFREKLPEETPPSKLFRRLRSRNPAPYGFMINLGEQEYLVGASPEMFVRCEAIEENDYRAGALRVETCPISGTVARGVDALEDALNVKSLMMNAKEESELTMCTDVDRNDKSRICEPGSVKVIGRRQIEMYSRLIHTVDHVEGYLRPEFDALDAFLCHTWAVTVTGAPKTWAMKFVEENERSPRCWYGGAVGMVGFDGSLNTGLTLRTVRVKNGIAEVRAGATLLYDSSPPAEELETELKAAAMIDAIVMNGPEDYDSAVAVEVEPKKIGEGKSLILIDHEDSFVHTLGNYLRQTGAEVKTLRSGASALAAIEKLVADKKKPDMVVLSPGPGNPSDFGLSDTIALLIKHKIPCFGVCLGLQGMVEHFGGTLGVLSYPMHGKPSQITVTAAGRAAGSIFNGLPDNFEVARYHSLHGIKERLPSTLEITAISDDGIVMAIKHKTLPFAAVQFHPESILTSPVHGLAILSNALTLLSYDETGEDTPPTGSELVGQLEKLSLEELQTKLSFAGLSTVGSKSELVVRLALYEHKKSEGKRGRLVLGDMSEIELRELKQGLGLKAEAGSRDELVNALAQTLL